MEVFRSAENLWTVTAASSFHFCSACDVFALTWSTGGWQLQATFADWESDCYNANCGIMQRPFVQREVTVTPHFDLSSYSTAKLTWTEHHRDFSLVVVYVSPDGGATWTVVSEADYTGTSTFEGAREVEIVQYLGSARSDVRLRFELIAGTNQFPRRVTGNPTYTCRAAIKNVLLTAHK